MDVDGYYNWWIDAAGGGFFPTYILEEIVEKLTELNFDWDLEIRNAFSTK
jgi:hypothetical protein